MNALDAGRRRAPGFEITPILKPLEPFRDQITVVGNLSRAGGKTVTDHAVSSAGWLSGVVAKQTEAEDISVGITHRSGAREADRPGHAVPVARVRDRGLHAATSAAACRATAAPT